MKYTVCVDLDGVLADYSQGWQGVEKIGEPLPGAVLFTQQLQQTCRVVIFTTRCKEMDRSGTNPNASGLYNLVREWLDRNGFAYDEVYVGQGKPFAAAYIDDRAVVCRPQDEGEAAYEAAHNALRHLIPALGPSVKP